MTSFGWQRSRSLGKDCQYRWELARLKMLLNLLFPRRRRRRLPSSRIVVSSYLPHPPRLSPPRSLYFMTFNIVATNFNFARHLLLILLLCACRTNANKHHQPNQHPHQHHPPPPLVMFSAHWHLQHEERSQAWILFVTPYSPTPSPPLLLLR